jgi:DNA-directed RNA polymerase specialized sigma subunit
MTQSAIAKVFGMTQMQVSRMERRVLSALKEEMLKD